MDYALTQGVNLTLRAIESELAKAAAGDVWLPWQASTAVGGHVTHSAERKLYGRTSELARATAVDV